MYYANNYKGVAGDYVIVKGQLNNGTWEMSSAIAEHFVKNTVNGVDADIFTWYNADKVAGAHKNATDLEFEVVPEIINKVPVYFATIDANNVIKYNGAMETADKVVKVKYTVTLVNGETCVYEYNVVFVNPFVAGESDGISVVDGIGENTNTVKPEVLVNDIFNDVILSWNGKNLVYSDKANNDYHLNKVQLNYAFEENDAYKKFVSQLADGSILKVDNNGKVTWLNKGSLLQKDHTFTVNVTVNLGGVSIVICKIPVTIDAK